MTNVKNDLFQMALIYFIITLSGFLAWKFIAIENQIFRFLIADLVMTLVCFLFSLIKRNASVYDAYWSVIPFLFCLQLAYIYFPTLTIWHYFTFSLVSVWSWRLSINWMRSWGGFSHVDWRYLDLAKKSGKSYPIVNFLGIHLFPTLMVFAGMLPLFFLFSDKSVNTIILFIGLVIGIVGIGFEYFADNELFKFRKDNTTKKEDILRSGLWARSRYPNYLGEILFWLGIAVIGQAYNAPWYTISGCLSIAAMILFVSIPMKERRMLERRPNFKKYQEEVPLIIPKFAK